jgi:hypothetical protein
MIRCVRMWTGEDGDSLFEEGWIDLSRGTRGDSIGEPVRVVELSFQETRSGGSYVLVLVNAPGAIGAPAARRTQ